jgi:hypothetical protein
MLDLERQLAAYGDYLDALDADVPAARSASKRTRRSRRMVALATACAAVLAATAVWVLVQRSPSPAPRVTPAATTTPPITTNPVGDAPFVSSTRSFIVLRYPTGLWRVRITKQTQFCRAEKGCAATRDDLRVGDRIEATVPNKTATRVVVNSVVATAQIDAINGDAVTLHNTRSSDRPNPPYTLILLPDTIFVSGSATSGQGADLQVGDGIYYTGWAASPEGAYTGQAAAPGVDSTVYAARVFPQSTASTTVPSSPVEPVAPVPDIIDACPPQQPVPAPETADALVSARQAARRYALTTMQWPSVQVVRAYHVGAGDTSYESMYRYQITRSCGSAVADASYGVDLSNPDGDSSTSSRAALVVAHFADGWRVWARFYN